jgi:hypothetical protein
MDELLKASSRKRQAEFGTDPVMPNPMRTRLHEEIAALGRKTPRPGRRFSFAWPRFAIAAAAAALVVALPILFQLRESKRSKILSARDADATARASETSERANEKHSEASAETVETKSDAPGAAGAPAAAAKSASITQQFAQNLAKPELNDAKMGNILNNFRLEQDG